MRLDILGEGHTPCPTQYDAKLSLAKAMNKMPTATFKSSSQQRKEFHDPTLPPPGAYQPDDASSTYKFPNAGASLGYKSERFRGTGFSHSGSDRGTGPDIAPGMHDGVHSGAHG